LRAENGRKGKAVLENSNMIGQELLACGLLVPVCYDIPKEDKNEDEKPFSLSNIEFSSSPYAIYRFPARSATAGSVGSYTLFGGGVTLEIPVAAHVDEKEQMMEFLGDHLILMTIL
jgi:hypothetical protein